MSPYVHPSPDIDQHPQGIRRTTPEPRSSSVSTILSSDTINTAPSDLTSEILNGSLSPRSNLVSPSESTNTKTSQTTKLGPFTQHKRFFFEDGNITFLVDGVLYRVHRYFFCRDSKIFMTRLSRLPAQEGSSLPVISLEEDIKSKDFDAFLSVLYPLNFNALQGHSFEELSSILALSTRWGFTNIRDMAIRCMEPPTPHERLVLARKYNVDEWVPLALRQLCERPQPLTSGEARLMDFEDVVLVGSVRERVRNTALMMDSAEMRDCIEALRRGEPWTTPPAGATASPIPSSAPTTTTPFSPFGAASTSATSKNAGFDGFGKLAGVNGKIGGGIR